MISLILCTLGTREKETKRLFNSLDAQTNQDFEVIVISQDNHEIIDNLLKNVGFFYKHIKSKERGLSKGRNIALDLISGEYFTLSDDDCWYPDNAMEIAVSVLKESDAAVVEFQHADAESRVLYRNYPLGEINRLNVRQILSIASFELFIKTGAIADLRFDERFGVGSIYNSGEEAIFVNDLRKKGHFIAYSPNLIAYHYVKGRRQYLQGKNIIAKGAIFGRIFPKGYAWFIFLLFCLKNRCDITWKYVFKGLMGAISIKKKPSLELRCQI